MNATEEVLRQLSKAVAEMTSVSFSSAYFAEVAEIVISERASGTVKLRSPRDHIKMRMLQKGLLESQSCRALFTWSFGAPKL